MSNLLPTDYQTFIATSRYARWLDKEGRRENWGETVSRYMDNIVRPVAGDNTYIDQLEEAILNLSVMPSMRSLMTAGPAAARDNTCMYNCSYLPVDDLKAFDEAMFILLCGTGVGFSVERQFISKLPEVPQLFESETTIFVKDSKEGWAKALRQVIALLYSGEIPKWDVSKVRPAGARLKTFGGRASGPAPLIDLFNFTVATFKSAQGRKLSSVECHDLMCKIGEVVVVGGVRRSAMISLSNLSDDRRGIFNRQASKNQAEKNGRRDPNFEFGTNPCSEIILRPNQFCNLTECVVRATDTFDTLAHKVKLATILGTIQSTYTKMPYLRKIWTTNTEAERLLGVSLTGIMDNPLMTSKNAGLDKTLEKLREIAIETNAEWAGLLDIPVAAAISCVKPSGTVSQLVDSASGIHARHNNYYIRTVRGDNKDPLTQFMIDQGIPSEPCVMKPEQTTVFSFPMKSPSDAVTRNDTTAIEQLETWLTYQRHWCEHKPSVTISVKDSEWMEVGAFVYKHFDEMSGVSFLPHSDHTYQQAPYQDCGKSEYEQLLSLMPKAIDWTSLADYEKEDNTSGSQTMACSGDSCEIVDLT
jgi:ribonucleoside-triphosphate reductase